MIRFALVGMFLIMFTLKLCGEIAWSWWWVSAPLWGPLVFLLAIAGCCWALLGICLGLEMLFNSKQNDKK